MAVSSHLDGVKVPDSLELTTPTFKIAAKWRLR
jgi:hypothetical protein